MKRIFLFISLFLITFSAFAHEPWLLTPEDFSQLNQLPIPEIFSQLTTFNLTISVLAGISLLVWIWLFTFKFPNEIDDTKLKYALQTMRIMLGIMLIFCSLGFLPRVDVAYATQPTLFTPDMQISTLPHFWHFIKWVELILGVFFAFNIAELFSLIILYFLLVLACFYFTEQVWQYLGFYLGITLYLLILNLTNHSRKYLPFALLVLQLLTGINFIFSSITMKWLQPNLDIGILQYHHAFTFGIPYTYFAFLMLVVEFCCGVLILFGAGLRYLSYIMFLLFIFLSITVKENFLAHFFIYGILFNFIFLDGEPILLPPSKRRIVSN